MFNNLGWGELFALGVLALLIFGPDRLPGIARQAARAVRQFREMATGAKAEIRSGLGDDFKDLDLRSMHPKRWLMDDEPARGRATRRPAEVLPPGKPAPFDPDAT